MERKVEQEQKCQAACSSNISAGVKLGRTW